MRNSLQHLRQHPLQHLILIAYFCSALLLQSCYTPEPNPLPLSKAESHTPKLYPQLDREIIRNFPETDLDIRPFVKGKKEVQQHMQALSKSNTGFDQPWIIQGPGNIGARITTLAISPDNEDIIFAGFAGGGLWRTIDGGTNWTSIFDTELFNSIGDITIDPKDSNTIYVGTGDPNVPGRSYIGDGLYKSTDGGDSWIHLGLTEQRIIPKIAVHPENSDILFAASMGLPFERNDSRGLFKSNDAGETWSQTFYISDSTGVTDLIIHPDNPDIMHVSTWDRIRNDKESLVQGETSGIWRTADGGQNWSRAIGIPDTIACKTGLATCKAQPEYVYAIVVNTDKEVGGIYRSTDSGETFTELPTERLRDDSALGGFGWYFAKITVDPTDPHHIYVLGVDLWETTDAGESWNLATPIWWTYEVHADKHDLQILDNGNMYLATDGGMYKTNIDSLLIFDDFFIEGWEDIENIPTTQFYRVAYNPHNPDLYYGGAQDNGTTAGNIEEINDWERVFGGDGFQTVFNPIDPDHFFAETQRGGIYMTYDGGNSFEDATSGLEGNKNWDMPYLMSMYNPDVMYAGTDAVYRADNAYFPEWYALSDTLTAGGYETTFSSNISCLCQGYEGPNILYAGTSNGLLHLSKNGGFTWEVISEDLPDRYMTSVKASPSNDATAYVTLSGYKFNEFVPRVYRTDDYGQSWTSIADGLPDMAVNDILVLPDYDDNVLFVATDGGVYGTVDAGESWERLGVNMPNIPCYDLVINEAKQELVAATFGRSIMTYRLEPILDLVSSKEVAPSTLGFEVHPNIASERIFIHINKLDYNNLTKPLSMDIYNVDGQLIESQMINKASTSLEISSYPSGTYFINMRNQRGGGMKRFVKT